MSPLSPLPPLPPISPCQLIVWVSLTNLRQAVFNISIYLSGKIVVKVVP